MLRRLLREQLKRIEQGLDPINVVRDPSSNKRIQTGAMDTDRRVRTQPVGKAMSSTC